jgi:hypothetical protein
MKCRNSLRNAETQYLMHKFETNYSSYSTGKRSENICSSSGGAQENGKTG